MVIGLFMRWLFRNGDRLDGETVFVFVMLLLISILGMLYLYLGLYGGMSY